MATILEGLCNRGDFMNEKTLKALEYYKIIDLLVEKAESQLGKDKIRETKPLVDIKEIEYLLRETVEAYS